MTTPLKIYFNGDYCNLEDSKVPVADRGYIFGDGIYEVFLIINGKFIDFDAHMARFKRSLSIMKIEMPEFDNISQITNKLLEMVEQGLLDKDTVIMACVKYMSEDDVADMMHCNEFNSEDEEDEEWEES